MLASLARSLRSLRGGITTYGWGPRWGGSLDWNPSLRSGPSGALRDALGSPLEGESAVGGGVTDVNFLCTIGIEHLYVIMVIVRNTRRTRGTRRRSVRKLSRNSRTVARRLDFGNRQKTYRNKRTGKPRFVLYNGLVQNKLLTSLKYCDTKTLSPGGGAAFHTFRLNSINDPDYTGVGHQPLFHDQWAALYSSYRVLGCKVRATFHAKHVAADEKATHTGATDTYPFTVDEDHREAMILFMEASENTTRVYTESTDLNTVREMGGMLRNVKWAYLKPNKLKTLQMQPKFKDLFDEVADYDVNTAIGADPANALFIHIGCMSKDGSVMSDVVVDLHISYLVEFSEPIEVEGS